MTKLDFLLASMRRVAGVEDVPDQTLDPLESRTERPLVPKNVPLEQSERDS